MFEVVDVTEKKENDEKKNQTKVVNTSSNKRKKSDTFCLMDEEKNEQAKRLCRNAEEYSHFCELPPKKQKLWLDQKKFASDQAFKDGIFGHIHGAYAFLIDKLTKSDGYTQQKIVNDLEIKKCLENELTPLLGYLNNRLQLSLLTTSGIIQGKTQQKKENPEPCVVIEEEEGNDATTGNKQKDEQIFVPIPAVPEPSDCPETGEGKAQRCVGGATAILASSTTIAAEEKSPDVVCRQEGQRENNEAGFSFETKEGLEECLR